MGAIATLNTEIESIIDCIDYVNYYRVTGMEANKILMKSKTKHCYAFHSDQTTVTGVTSNPAHIYLTVPIQIYFLYNQNKLDDTLKTVDNLVDKAEDIANEFFYRLSQSEIITALVDWDDFSIERLEAYKRFDPVLSGVLFTWNAPLTRTQCQ